MIATMTMMMVAMMTTAMRMIVLTMTETMTIATTMIATMMIVMTAIGTAMKATTMIVMTMNDSNYNDGNEDNSNEHCHQKSSFLINDIENWPSHNCKQLPNLAHGRKTHQPWYHWQPQHPYLFLCHSCKLDASTLHLN